MRFKSSSQRKAVMAKYYGKMASFSLAVHPGRSEQKVHSMIVTGKVVKVHEPTKTIIVRYSHPEDGKKYNMRLGKEDIIKLG